jgi:hypothetical protein
LRIGNDIRTKFAARAQDGECHTAGLVVKENKLDSVISPDTQLLLISGTLVFHNIAQTTSQARKGGEKGNVVPIAEAATT